MSSRILSATILTGGFIKNVYTLIPSLDANKKIYSLLNYLLLLHLVIGAAYVALSSTSNYQDYYALLAEKLEQQSSMSAHINFYLSKWFSSKASLFTMVGIVVISITKEFLIKSISFKLLWNSATLGSIFLIALYVGYLESII